MTPIANALSSVINGKNDLCCLCLKTIQDEPIRLSDEIILNDDSHNTSVEEVLYFMFDEAMNNYISTFNSICEQCTKMAISYYKFIHTCQKNSDYFTNILNGITNSFEYTTNEFSDSKSLFVSLNVHDFTSKHYYDMRHTPSSCKAALKRYHQLDNTEKIKIENPFTLINETEKDYNTAGLKKRRKIPINIPSVDMLLDKNNPDDIKCKECKKEFLNLLNLRSHFIRVHAPKTFKCPDCPRSYGSASYLETHRNDSHCTIVCSECGKTFYNRQTLKMHELGHHLTLVCQDCGRVYKNNTTFKKHKDQNVCGQITRAHPSEAKFTCDYCNKKYTQKMSLRVHIQHEHGNYKGHVCEWCGKKFWAQSRLKAHMVKHTKERNFPCTVCGGRFVSKESLLYHTRTHTGEKPYKCPHCEYRFLSASRRSEHVKRHHLGGTLECDICHSKFNTRTYLLKHKKTHMKHSEKTNLKHRCSKSKTSKSDHTKHTNQSKNILPKINLNTEITSRDIWKIDELVEVGIQSFENVIESAEVQIQNLNHGIYEEHDAQQSSEDRKVYLEVSDDTDDFIKLVGLGT